MKLKVFALSLAVVAGAFNANAQVSDVFVGVGGGVISNYSNHFISPAFYGQIQVGAYFTPVIGSRVVLGGLNQKLDADALAVGWVSSGLPTKQLFGELNLDGMVNFSQLFSKQSLPKLDVYLFLGPTVNFSKEGSKYSSEIAHIDGKPAMKVVPSDKFLARVGATAGLGIAYNITDKWAVGAEGRFGITPSIFGPASTSRSAEGTLRGTINVVYTIGGKSGKDGYAKKVAEKAGYVSAATAAAMVADALEKNPKIVEKIVEKPVERIVEKVVNLGSGLTPTAIFFEIGKANVTLKDKARVKLVADAIKTSPTDFVYEIAGYADKATGSANFNQTLSEKRADAIYNLLVGEGVNPSQLVKVANGGVNPLFFNSNALSRAAIVTKK